MIKLVNPADYVKNSMLRILVKAGKRENKIIGYDEARGAVIVEISAPAKDNKANLEVIKYFSKLLKKHVMIKSGHTSKEKVLIIY
jgi:uncharacterized protein